MELNVIVIAGDFKEVATLPPRHLAVGPGLPPWRVGTLRQAGRHLSPCYPEGRLHVKKGDARHRQRNPRISDPARAALTFPAEPWTRPRRRRRLVKA